MLGKESSELHLEPDFPSSDLLGSNNLKGRLQASPFEEHFEQFAHLFEVDLGLFHDCSLGACLG